MPGNDSKGSGAQNKRIKRPGPIKVYISENAFMGLLLSSAEVFMNESLGYLPVYRLDDRFIVEYAFGLQTAKIPHILSLPPRLESRIKYI